MKSDIHIMVRYWVPIRSNPKLHMVFIYVDTEIVVSNPIIVALHIPGHFKQDPCVLIQWYAAIWSENGVKYLYYNMT